MPQSKIKAGYENTHVAFGKNNLPLGRNPDIDDLALIAQESNNPELLKYFQEPLPSPDEIRKAKVANIQKPQNTTNETKQQQNKQSPAAEEEGQQGK